MSDAVIIRDGVSTAVFVGTPDAASAAASASGAASSATSASASASAAAANAAAVADVRNALAIRPVLPVGWFDPTNYPEGAWYRNDFNLKFFSNGLRVFTMMPASAIGLNSAWLDPANLSIYDDSGVLYQAVGLDNVLDPCKAFGVTVTTLHVSPSGNDTTGTGGSGSPYRTDSKARAVANATPGTYDIVVHCTGDFIGTETMPAATRTISQNIRYSFVNDGTGPGLWCPAMRETFPAGTWAWVNLGGGYYQCLPSNANISTNAKNTPSVYDPSVVDGDGKPISSPFVAGAYADGAAAKAAIVAAVGSGPGYNYNATSGLVLRLASGASPIPGKNFIYSELSATDLWQGADGSRLCVRGFKNYSNLGRTANNANFAFRPSSLVLGPSSPNIVHDISAVFADCGSLGSSGNAFQHQSGYRVALVRCTDYDSWLDAANAHTIYNFGSNSNSPDEGLYDHMFVDRHLSSGPHSGGDGRNPALAPAVNTSANGPTCHERCRMTVINSRFSGSNGSNCAVVTGARLLSFGNSYSGVRTVNPADQVFSAAFLASDISAANVERATIFSAYDSAYVPGDVTGRSAVFYAGPSSDIALLGFNGVVTKVTERHIKLAANPANGNTVTIDQQTYTFKTMPAGPFDVQIGADRTITSANLTAAITANASTPTGLYARQGDTVTTKVRKLVMFGQAVAVSTNNSAAITVNATNPTITELSGFGGPQGIPGGPLADGTYGDISVSSSGTFWSIGAGKVTNTALANMAQGTLKGRASAAGTGAATDLTGAQAKAILAITASDVAGLGGAATANLDTDGTMAANSDTVVASQKAVRTYVATAITGTLKFKGSQDCSANPNYPPASRGDVYVVSVAGKIGGASGVAVDVGDEFFAIADNAGGTQAAVGASWTVLEHNFPSAPLLATNNLSDLASAPAARGNLGLVAIAASGSGADLTNATVSYSKIQNVAASSILGNPSGSAASASEITLGTGLAFSGSTVVVTATSKRTVFSGSGTWTKDSRAKIVLVEVYGGGGGGGGGTTTASGTANSGGSGGGGGGGANATFDAATLGGTETVTIGAAGTGGAAGAGGGAGGTSSFGAWLQAFGGGGGGPGQSAANGGGGGGAGLKGAGGSGSGSTNGAAGSTGGVAGSTINTTYGGGAGGGQAGNGTSGNVGGSSVFGGAGGGSGAGVAATPAALNGLAGGTVGASAAGALGGGSAGANGTSGGSINYWPGRGGGGGANSTTLNGGSGGAGETPGGGGGGGGSALTARTGGAGGAGGAGLVVITEVF